MTLYEKYRPRTLAQVVGQPKTCAQLQGLIDRNALAGKAYWISGASGTGKTTIARIIALQVADDWATLEYDSADQVTQAEYERIDQWLKTYSLGKGGRAVIINEAHGLRKPIIRQLLGLLERIPHHSVVVFTTTKDGQEALFEDYDDAAPLLSRCCKLPLTNQGLAKAFAEHVMQVARAEGLDGQPIEAYLKLASRCRNNARAMLVEVESGCMIGGGA